MCPPRTSACRYCTCNVLISLATGHHRGLGCGLDFFVHERGRKKGMQEAQDTPGVKNAATDQKGKDCGVLISLILV